MVQIAILPKSSHTPQLRILDKQRKPWANPTI